MVLRTGRIWSALSLALAIGALAVACGPRKRASAPPIGTSAFDEDYGIDAGQGGASADETSTGGSSPTGGGAATGGAATGGAATGGAGSGGASASTSKQVAFVLPDPAIEAARREALEAAKEEAFARSLLARAATPEGSSGLVFVVGQRASDLPWTLAIENRSDKPLQVAGDPHLLSFELLPQPPKPIEEPAVDAAATGNKPVAKPLVKAKPAPVPKPKICGPAVAPKTVAEDAWLELPPGELITYSFDPRPLCIEAGELTRGLRIAARYGFAVETKKTWIKGKVTEEALTAKPPFIAKWPTPTAEAPILPKNLTAEVFELDETYPLEGVSARPTPSAADGTWGAGAAGAPDANGADGADAADGSSAAGKAKALERPPLPLTLRVSPLGSAEEIDETTVTFTLANQSKKSVELFLRRELIVYEILGPRGASTCRMQPAARAPDRTSFETVGSGGSRTLTTRLAEACPPTTFAAPGTYAVSARFEARAAGTEHGFDAFTGDISTERPARFLVRGDKATTKQSSGFRISKKP